MIENIPFLLAALSSGHNTYIHSPLSDITALNYDSHEMNFYPECQPFSILSGAMSGILYGHATTNSFLKSPTYYKL